MAVYGKSGRRIDRAKFAAKCIADNFGWRGDESWTRTFEEVRAGQKAHNITDADFEGMNLDELRQLARITD